MLKTKVIFIQINATNMHKNLQTTQSPMKITPIPSAQESSRFCRHPVRRTHEFHCAHRRQRRNQGRKLFGEEELALETSRKEKWSNWCFSVCLEVTSCSTENVPPTQDPLVFDHSSICHPRFRSLFEVVLLKPLFEKFVLQICPLTPPSIQDPAKRRGRAQFLFYLKGLGFGKP